MATTKKGIKAELPPEKLEDLKWFDKKFGQIIKAAFAKPKNPSLPWEAYFLAVLMVMAIVGAILLVISRLKGV